MKKSYQLNSIKHASGRDDLRIDSKVLDLLGDGVSAQVRTKTVLPNNVKVFRHYRIGLVHLCAGQLVWSLDDDFVMVPNDGDLIAAQDMLDDSLQPGGGAHFKYRFGVKFIFENRGLNLLDPGDFRINVADGHDILPFVSSPDQQRYKFAIMVAT